MSPSPTITRRQFALGAASLALAQPRFSLAQGTPVPESPTALRVAVRLGRLPANRVDAFFARYILDAGAEVPSFQRTGSALLLVERGTIALTSSLPVTRRAAGQVATPAVERTGGDIMLQTGEVVLVPNDARMSLRNDAGVPASLLALVIWAPYREFSYTHPTELPGLTGVTRQVIGFSAGAFEEGPAILLIERDEVRSGGSAYSTTLRGIEIGGIESGSARATFRTGTGWVTPNALQRTDIPLLPGDTQIPAGDTVQMDTLDAYACIDGSINWRAIGNDPLVVLRGQLVPVPRPRT